MAETLNTARLKKGNEIFEVVVDPEKAILARQGAIEVREAVMYPKIYSDAKKGLLASEQRMKALFGTSEPLQIAKLIITQGDVQLTSEYRQKLLQQKRARIIDLIHRQGVDPRTNAPHPAQRIDAAMDEAKIRIDEFKPGEQQVQGILKALRPILPIKLVTKQIEVHFPPEYSGRAHGVVKPFGRVLKESWEPNGGWKGIIEIPGGLEQEFFDKLNNITKGQAETKIVKVSE